MKKQRELRAATFELRIATNEDGSHTLTGLIPYNSSSVDLGGFTEIIAPGAFKSALSRGSDILCLRDHDSKLLLGRTKSGTLSLRDTADGLEYSCKLPATTAGNDLFESAMRGDLDSTSFGFITNSDDWQNTKGNVVRTLLDVDLLEVSPCSFPAYESTSVSVRSCPVEIRSLLTAEKRDDLDADPKCNCECTPCTDGDCGDCDNEDCADEACSCSDERSVVVDGDTDPSWAELTELRIRVKQAFSKS